MSNDTPPPQHDWLIPEPPATSETVTDHAPRRSRTRLGGAAALVAAGVLAGGGVAFAVGHHSDDAGANVATSTPFGEQGQQRGGFGGFGAPGGVDGELRLQGTLTAVGSSSVSLKTSAGTSTYAVTSATQIIRNGAPATLSQLKAGEQVFVHVYPSGSGSGLTVERLFVGTPPQFGGGPGDSDGGDGTTHT